ncbi:MAG: hypothetical protein R3D81_07780 [Thalassovita sp.]
MPRLLSALTALSLLLPLPALADEITDALDSAKAAYAEGDIQYAIEELEFARNKLLALKTDALGAYLPDAPDGWARTINSDMGAGLAMMGGGVGAEANYDKQDGSDSYTITLMADNPMIASIAGMINNAAMMGVKVERIGRQKFMVQDSEITGLVANRVLVKITGSSQDTMMAALEQMDFAAMGNFKLIDRTPIRRSRTVPGCLPMRATSQTSGFSHKRNVHAHSSIAKIQFPPSAAAKRVWSCPRPRWTRPAASLIWKATAFVVPGGIPPRYSGKPCFFAARSSTSGSITLPPPPG